MTSDSHDGFMKTDVNTYAGKLYDEVAKTFLTIGKLHAIDKRLINIVV